LNEAFDGSYLENVEAYNFYVIRSEIEVEGRVMHGEITENRSHAIRFLFSLYKPREDAVLRWNGQYEVGFSCYTFTCSSKLTLDLSLLAPWN
jgi:hypothetical protein